MPAPVRPDPLLDLLKQRDDEIDQADRDVTAAQSLLDQFVRARDELLAERATLAEMAARRGIFVADPRQGPPAIIVTDADWSDLRLVDAVERLLKSAAPEALHLTQIESGLHQRNRWDDKAESISGTLTYLKQKRGTAIPLGGGRWAYSGPGAAGPNAASEVRDYPEFRDELAKTIEAGRGQSIGENAFAEGVDDP